MKLDDEGNVGRAEPSSGAVLYLEEGPSLVYEEREPPAATVKEVGSRKRKLSSSVISIGEMNRSTPTLSRGEEEDYVQRAQKIEAEIEVDKEEITMVSSEVEAKNITEVETEKTVEMGTKKPKR